MGGYFQLGTVFPSNRRPRTLWDEIRLGNGEAVPTSRAEDSTTAPRAFTEPQPEEIQEQGPPVPTRLQSLESALYAIDNPQVSTRNKILKAIMTGAPTLAGGILGGEAGASGAAYGTNQFLERQRAEEAQRRGTLAQEIEAERERQNKLEQQRIAAQSRTDIATMSDEFKRHQDEWKQRDAQLKTQIAQQRADSYAANIESLSGKRGADAETSAARLEAQINRDTNLDEFRRAGLQQQLDIARMNISQRQAEEAGRTSRNAATIQGAAERNAASIAGAAARTKMTQDAIAQRQQNLLDKGWDPARIGLAWNYALRGAQNLGTWDNMSDEDQADLVEGLADSFLSQSMPELGTEPRSDLPGRLGLPGKQYTAQPGQPAQPRLRSAAPVQIAPAPPPPQEALPPEAVAQLKPGVNTTFANGQVWTLGPNGQPQRVK
jgi:hypothetical protein